MAARMWRQTAPMMPTSGTARNMPEDAGELATGRDHDEHDGGVEADRPAVDQWRDDAALDDVEDRGIDAHDHDVLGRAERDGDQEPDQARDELADVRDEPAEEREDGDRQGQGQTEQGHDDEAGHGIEQGQDAGGDHVAAQHRHRSFTGQRDLVPAPAIEMRDDPRPSPVAVAQHEVGEQRGDDEEPKGQRDAAGDRRDGLEDPRAQGRGHLAGGSRHPCRQGRVRDARAVDRAGHGLLDVGTQGGDGQDRHDRHDDPHHDADHEGRPASGPAPSFERRDRRQERRGQGHRDHDRTDHDRELRQDGDHEPEQADRDEQAPAPLGEAVEPHRDVALDRHPLVAGCPEGSDDGPRDCRHDGDGRHGRRTCPPGHRS